MNTIRFAIDNPVKVAVGGILLVLFGLIAVFTIPIQLVPNVDQPVITVTTSWVGRSPEEVEREIVEEQEDYLKSIANLKKMSASSSLGQASITLEFYVGTDMTRALQEVSDKLREVPEYPPDVDQPVITVADSASSDDKAIAWMIIAHEDPAVDVAQFFDAVDKRVKPYLERVSGIAEINVYGGREREVHIQVDPVRLANRGITFNQLAAAIRVENVNVSAGNLATGRLESRVRTIGQYEDTRQVEETIIAYDAGGPIRVRDVATVEVTLEKERAFVRANGQAAMAVNAIRESGANVVSIMADLRVRVDEANRDVLPTIDPGLSLRQVYDETVYIYDALNLVRDNLWQGGVLTVLVLLFFLRHTRRPLFVLIATPIVVVGVLVAMAAPAVQLPALLVVGLSLLAILATSPPTAIIALAIPLSVIGTFVALTGLGRNLNVISLAGLAFAIGMVVDNAIVVIENIDRHLAMGKAAARAAYDGTREVFAAVIASTLTTLVVFIPVLTIEEEAGQLFLDISLAICCSVAISLVVSVTVIPTAASRWLHGRGTRDSRSGRLLDSFFGAAPVLQRGVDGVAEVVYRLTRTRWLRVAIVALFTGASIGGAYLLMPPTDYLPKGNQNLVFGIMLKPPGYSLEQERSLADRMEATLRPYWEAESYRETEALGPVTPMFGPPIPGAEVPPIDSYFFVSWGGMTFMGAASADKENVGPLGPLLGSAAAGIPGTMVFAEQASIFGMGLGGSRSIEVELSGTDLDAVRDSASTLNGVLTGKYGFGKVNPDPMNFDMPGPELRVKVDRVRAADLGVDVAALGLGVQSLVDGATIGDYRHEGESIDLLLTRPPAMALTPESLASVPVAVSPERGGGTVPLSAIARIERADAPQTIKRIEQLRAISLAVVPPDTIPIEQAMGDIRGTVDELRASGAIAPGVEVTLAGTADKLTQVRESLLGAWHGWTIASFYSLFTSRMFLALLVCYLVMCAVFESFLYPFVILFSVPLATIGGFLGLRLVHDGLNLQRWPLIGEPLYGWLTGAGLIVPTQMLDVVTMLGFVILIGMVVNNAILIVAQALNFMQGFGESAGDKLGKALTPHEAIRESVRTRMRPVLMTTITTLFGMMPLVLKPGSGSELYRGLGAVVLGGLVCATVFTLILVPLVLSIVLDLKLALYRWRGWEAPEMR